MIGHVLVIDPLTTNRIVLKAKLSCAHYSVTCVATIQEALSCITSMTPDFIFVDAALGPNTIKQLRRLIERRSDTMDVPIIATHDSRVTPNLADTLRSGAHDLMQWPMKADVVRARMRGLTRRAQTLDILRNKAHFIGGAPTGYNPLSERSECSKIVVISRNMYLAQQWADKFQLAEKIPQIEAFGYAEILHAQRSNSENTINLLIDDHMSEPDDILHILSSLKARDHGSHSFYVAAFLEGAQAQAATALDLGADDIAWIGDDMATTATKLRVLSKVQRQIQTYNLVIEDRLRLAVIDPLTGLFNRRYCDQKLAFMTGEAATHDETLAVMLLDIDHFKTVNDRFGHAVGDRVLTDVAAALRTELRDSDLLARIGGEEFLVAMPQTNAADAIAAANRMREAIEALEFPVSLEPGTTQTFKVTASVGVATSATETCPNRITDRADKALYLAKSEGRNCARLDSIKAAA
jgi:two-component system cell cycle response regulator